jgi:hypothetical protein
MKVIRMFLTDDGVEVYSVADDNRAVMRNLVPSKTIRLTEETMPIDVFADELEAAEEDNFPGGDDPDDPDPDDPSKSPAPPAALPANGSAPS